MSEPIVRSIERRALPRHSDDLFWFNEAKKAHAEAAALTAELHRVRGLWYGACAARTEHAHALNESRLKIAKLEAKLARLDGDDHVIA